MLFTFLIAYLIFIIALEKIVIKKFNIKKKKGLYKPVNKVHKWSEIIFIIVILTIIFFVNELQHYFFPIFSTILFSFRAFMEWKFEKESKVFILSILSGSSALLVWIILVLFFFK